MTTVRINALKHEDEYREMTYAIIRYMTARGAGYYEIQEVWSWGYRKTKDAYRNLPREFK